jgi:hypothetical protein
MLRGLIFGGLAFGAAFAGERQFRSVFKDMQRYDRLRRMSGDSSLVHELLDKLFALLRERLSRRRGGAGLDTLGSLQNDVRRYLRIRSM